MKEKNLPLTNIRPSEISNTDLYWILSWYNDQIDLAVARKDEEAKAYLKTLVQPFLDETKKRLDSRPIVCKA